ncbi:hypothetical protein CBS101457_002832 [Exobasidium rhododendri]|nr:hypothetical protein CBS101457_002832 [Exobasidium rhododendri]
MAAYPIGIPGASSRMDVMSPNSMASPFSISSPYSANSSLSNISNAQTLASSFATSVTSTSTFASAVSPSECEMVGLDAGGGAVANAKKMKPHECDVCGACFASHDDRNPAERYTYSDTLSAIKSASRTAASGVCFSRQDSLVRHHRLLHEKIKEKPKRSSGSGKKKSSKEGTCSRCSNLGAKCDGKAPCTRCSTSDFNAQQCSYTVKSMKRERAATTGRRPSVSQMTSVSTSSSFGDEEEDMMSISEEATSAFSPHYGHGPRRATVSNMEGNSTAFPTEFNDSFSRSFEGDSVTATSSWTARHQIPHPFEMPPVEYAQSQQFQQHLAAACTPVDANQPFFDGTSAESYHQQQQQHHDQGSPLHPIYHQQTQEEAHSSTTPSVTMPSFDWTSLMQASMAASSDSSMETMGGVALPFSKAASNKSLNSTLSQGADLDAIYSPLPSVPDLPMAFPTEQQQQEGAVAAASMSISNTLQAHSMSYGTVNLASLGLAIPPNMNINVPANLQMSADNWDNLMRCLTSMANRQGEPMAS